MTIGARSRHPFFLLFRGRYVPVTENKKPIDVRRPPPRPTRRAKPPPSARTPCSRASALCRDLAFRAWQVISMRDINLFLAPEGSY